MKRGRRIATIGLFLAAAAGGDARADIYVSTGTDGAVTLSNVPAGAGYRLLVGDEARAGTSPPDAARPAPRSPSEYEPIIARVSRSYGIDGALLHAVVRAESGYDRNALSSKGAAGLMQLMPDTAKRYGVRDVFDPAQNLEGGARYLRDLLRLFGDDVELALAAYNAGEAAVLKHGRRIPPYGETQRYVPRVLRFYREYRPAS